LLHGKHTDLLAVMNTAIPISHVDASPLLAAKDGPDAFL
jgi:hypothetical protein